MPQTPFAKYLVSAIAAAILQSSSCAAGENEPPAALTSIDALDVARYMGKWYEIAKFPNRFQMKCVGETSAEYALETDGTLQVTNRCRMKNGEISVANGTARQIGHANSAKLQVRFAPQWLSFLPWVWGNYWVIEIADDYQRVAISEPQREFLWILSRTPTLPPEVYDSMLETLKSKGFDTEKLELTHP